MTTLEEAVDAYLEQKSVGDPDGPGAGTYASNATSILRRWAAWLAGEHGVTALTEIGVEHMRAYAQDLAVKTAHGEYTASTANTYFAVVRAFLSWCVRERGLARNPADTRRASAALPTENDRSRPQYWSHDERRALESFVRERADDAADGDPDERLARLREYALVTVLANTGIRGAELFRVPEDDRRSGATWDDVDFYTGTIRVLGKSQRLEDVPLPAPARTPLRRYRVVLDPPTNEWPLFPTRHAPSVASHVKAVLRERGHDEDALEELLAGKTAIELARERSIAPPAVTTEGARSILRRLCEGADIDIDGDYLKPQGARRGLDGEPRRTTATTAHGALRETFLEHAMVLVDDADERTDEDG